MLRILLFGVLIMVKFGSDLIHSKKLKGEEFHCFYSKIDVDSTHLLTLKITLT